MFDELEEEPRVDLTPLIDVIFMLVIFFVMTMTFSKPVLDVVLPAAQNSEVKKKTTELVISVKSDGKYFFNDQEIPKEEVSRFLSEHPDGTLNLMVDEKAPFEAFVYLADLAKVNREGRFVISTKAAAPKTMNYLMPSGFQKLLWPPLPVRLPGQAVL